MTDFAILRTHMVDSQVRTSDVTDRRIQRAMLAVPRENFVPEALRTLAYMDEAIGLGGSAAGPRFLMQPMVLAKLLELAQLTENDHVLDVGAGPGYGTALIARLARSVIGLESDTRLAGEARRLLAAEGAGNATIAEGPLAEGWREGAPYEVVIFSGAIAEVPAGFIEQTRMGGRLLAVVGEGVIGRATVFERIGNGWSRRVGFDAGIPALPGFAKTKGFTL
mgnify:CR=1 FL=1